MATVDELRKYVDDLPPIYREILEAFPQLEPNRKLGHGLAMITILTDFEERGRPYSFGQIRLACEQLADKGLVTVKNRLFVYPTEYGERLIGIITGHEATAETVPYLPSPPAG